jgi:hypothetical protein
VDKDLQAELECVAGLLLMCVGDEFVLLVPLMMVLMFYRLLSE